jgi:hypothetical protein
MSGVFSLTLLPAPLHRPPASVYPIEIDTLECGYLYIIIYTKNSYRVSI